MSALSRGKRRGRSVDPDDNLALHVHGGVVVVLLIGSGNAKADENERRAHLTFGSAAVLSRRAGEVGVENVVFRVHQLLFFPVECEGQGTGGLVGNRLLQGYWLIPASGHSGIEAHALELRGYVARGDFVAGRSGRAALEQAVGQKADVGANYFWTNRLERRVRWYSIWPAWLLGDKRAETEKYCGRYGGYKFQTGTL